MTDEPVVRAGRTAFRWGLGLGFVLALALGAASYLLIGREGYVLPFTVEVLSHGADVTGAGGASVVVKNGQGVVMTQTCRDGCDDLQLQAKATDNGLGVTVFDPAGKALTPSKPLTYVTGGVLTRFVVSNDGGLKVSQSYVDDVGAPSTPAPATQNRP